MTPDQLKEILNSVEVELEGAADFVGTLDPALVPMIIIGKAVARVIPGLAATVDGWIQGTPPTQADKDQKAAELAVLGNPGGPS